MIVERVEIIDELLVVLHCDVRLCFFDACDLGLVACKLLLDLFDHALIVFYLLFDFLIRDSFSRVTRSALVIVHQLAVLGRY